MSPRLLFVFAAASLLPTLSAQAQDSHAGNVAIGGSITQSGSGANDFNAALSAFDGRMCVGNACETTDSVGTGPMMLKWSQADLLFVDSSSSSFPDRDWRILINDGSFGIERFSIRDETEGTIPFTIQGGAPDDALFVDDDGLVGFGTSIPLKSLHVVDNEPALRLDHSLVSDFWDVFSDSNGFGISSRDGVSGVTKPNYSFNIAHDVGTEFWLTADGIGYGTDNPDAGLHINSSRGVGAILVEETGAGTLGQMTLRNNGITYLTLEDTSITAGNDTGRAWNFQNQNGTFRVTTAPGGAGDIEMILTPAGDMTIEGDLFTTGGVCNAGCDRVFDADYPLPTIAEQSAMMRSAKHLPAVGPTAETGLFNVTQKVGGMLNELEKAHLFIDQLNDQLQHQDQEIAMLRNTLAAVTARLDRIDPNLGAQ